MDGLRDDGGATASQEPCQVQEVADARHSESAEKISSMSSQLHDFFMLCPDDIKCLEPEKYLSSPIMDHYIRYLQGPLSSIKYHIFNTYFFTKLDAVIPKVGKVDRAAYLQLRRWWKGVHIFQKAYILLPVHQHEHWSLVIICMPAKEDRSGPIVLHMDSLKKHSRRLIFGVVGRFLKEEWNYLNENGSSAEFPIQEMACKDLPDKIENKSMKVPQQKNGYDCGIFVLYYMQRFIQEAPERLLKKDLYMFGKGWFQPEEASALRKKIQTWVLELFEEAKSKSNTAGPSTASEHPLESTSAKTTLPTEHPLEGTSAKTTLPTEHPLEGTSASVYGCEQELSHLPSSSEVAPPNMILSFVEKGFMDTTNLFLAKAVEGLDAASLGDPNRRAILEIISSQLTYVHVPGVSRAHEMLVQLIVISNQMQQAHLDFEAEARHELESHEEIMRNTCQELLSVEEQLTEVTNVSRKLQQDKERLQQIHSNHDSEVKKWANVLLDATKGLYRGNKYLQEKTTRLEQDAKQILKDLKNWRGGPN